LSYDRQYALPETDFSTASLERIAGTTEWTYMIIREIGRKSVAMFFAVAFPALCVAEDHVDPNCCRYPAGPNGINIQFFLESCAVPGNTARGMIPHFDCQSYVLGVIGAYKQLKSSVRKSRQMCLQSDITTKDVLELIWEQYPNWDTPANRQASEVILEVLQKRFSCGS
jgi:hypothetical protein